MFLTGVGLFLRSDFFLIEKIECQSNGGSCEASLWSGLMSRTGGENLLFLSSEKLVLEVQTKYPEIYKLTLKKKFPKTLSFKVEIRKPAVILLPQDGEGCLVDKDGYFLKKAEGIFGFPTIESSKKDCSSLGKKVEDKGILKGIEILYESQIRLLEPESGEMTSPRVVEVQYPHSLKVLFSTQKEIARQLDSLQFILDRTKIEGSLPGQVDLRFDKPVIIE